MTESLPPAAVVRGAHPYVDRLGQGRKEVRQTGVLHAARAAGEGVDPGGNEEGDTHRARHAFTPVWG
jgi:hypothetical protein